MIFDLDFHDLDDDWKYAKNVLCFLYGVLLAFSLAQLLRILYHIYVTGRQGIFFVMRVRLQMFLFLAVLARLTVMALPVSFYKSLNMKDVWIQVTLDLVPEVLFWLTYVLLVMLWAAMYYGSTNTNKDKLLKKTFLLITIATFISVEMLALIMQLAQTYKIIIEASFLFVLASATLIAFAVYGRLLYKRAKSLTLNANQKDTMLQKLQWIVIIVCVCDLIHCLYLIIVDIFADIRRPHWYVVMWFFYFLFTEITPAVIILYIFRKIPTADAPIKDPMKSPLLEKA